MTARTRTRNTAPAATPSMQQLAADYYFHSVTANKAAGVAKKAREALYAEMAAASLKRFMFTADTPDGKARLPLAVEIDTPTVQFIDTALLLKAVGQKKFMELVEASQTAVKSGAGDNIAKACLVSGLGKENVKVKPYEGA